MILNSALSSYDRLLVLLSFNSTDTLHAYPVIANTESCLDTKDVSPQLTELYFYDSPAADKIHEPGDEAVEVQIHDGWSRASEFTIDRNGFSMNDFQPKYPVDGFEDEESVRREFYPEVVDFLKQTTGASRVLVFDHTIRTKKNINKKLTQETSKPRSPRSRSSPSLTTHPDTSQRAPVRLVHCDYTSESAPTRVKQLLPDEAADLLTRRVAFLNLWYPLHRVEENPLAMCDTTSTLPGDFFKLHLRYRDRNGENYVLKHSEKHKWWYFPGMEADKCILLKTYDSEERVARFVGHSAFEDPTSRPDARVRESVEVRTICFF